VEKRQTDYRKRYCLNNTIYSRIMKKFRFKIIILVFLGFCLTPSIYSQISNDESLYHPYRVNYWVTGSLLSAGLVSNYLGIDQITNKKELSLIEIQGLNKKDVNKLDSWIFDIDLSNVNSFENYSDYTLISSIGLPVFLLFDKQIRRDWLDILLMYLETMSLTTNIYEWSFLGPHYQDRIRPAAYYEQLTYDQKKSGNNRNAFYSGHVASVAASTFFMAKVYCDYHPEIGNNKYLLYSAALVPPLVLGYFRIKALKHFPTDIGVGMAVGVLCAIIVPELHRTSDKTFLLESFSTPEAAGLSVKWQPGFMR
jgi:membrane-associated phospholipid phosphatase